MDLRSPVASCSPTTGILKAIAAWTTHICTYAAVAYRGTREAAPAHRGNPARGHCRIRNRGAGG
jgi:hypothetical protein